MVASLLTLVPSVAYAHAPGFAVLELRERPNQRVDAALRTSAAIDVDLIGCAEEPREDLPRASGIEARFSAHCAHGVTAVSVDGLDEPGAQLFVVLHRADGTVTRGVADAHRPRVELGAPDSSFGRYLGLGIEHVLAGFDHLLFVLGLLLFVRGARRIAATVTAFTLGHSVTLALAALDLVRVPAPPVECAIALSILLLALELAKGKRDSVAARHPAVMAASFGLLHGLGFASALRDAGLPTVGIAPALFGFNVGVELGQLAFVALVLVSIALAKKSEAIAARVPLARSITIHVLGGAAAYWTIARAIALGN